MTRARPRGTPESALRRARRDKCVSLGTAAFRIGPTDPLSIYTVGARYIERGRDGRVFLFPYKFISGGPYLRATCVPLGR